MWAWLKRRFKDLFWEKMPPPLPPGCWHPYRAAPEPVPPSDFAFDALDDDSPLSVPAYDSPRPGAGLPGQVVGGS